MRRIATPAGRRRLLAACGVATDDRAVPIDLGEQPPGLVATSTSTTMPVPDSKTVAVYFFDPQPEVERLVDRHRQAAPPVDVAAVGRRVPGRDHRGGTGARWTAQRDPGRMSN